MTPDVHPRRVTAAEALRLLEAPDLTILDVRTPDEFARLGHIPGARLLPVDLIAAAPAVIPERGGPVLVYCEHGIRSAHAADVLARAGVRDVHDLAGGMAAWHGPRRFGEASIDGPSGWLLANLDLLRRGMRVLDVAAGRGRHALLLAAAGFPVTAVDRDDQRLRQLQQTADRAGWPVRTVVHDLEAPTADLGDQAYDLILVTHYLHRPLFPAIVRALAADGVLLYETFTTAQAARGKPTNPDFLLRPGELPQLVAPLEVLRAREGEFDGRMVASVAARTPRT